MSTVIGAMEAYLKLNIDDFEKNLKDARKQVESISSGFDVLTAVGDKMSSVGNKLTLGLTTPVIGLGTACVKTTADFDATMSKVSAISGVTGQDLQALRDKAKEMGAQTKFSAGEAGEAFTYMAMAGWDAGQMIDGISGIMDLAAADGLDLATTSDIVTDALTAFGLQAKDSGHFADVLAKASSSANTNVSMLGESFKYVAPVAGAMGYSVEDVAVALGLMANSGIKAGQAGTAMRAALTRMAKPTDKAAELMEEYRLSITNSDGSMKSLAEVMIMLRENMGSLTEAEQIQAATTIFGQEAMSGMLAIINASDEDFKKLTNSINDADGTAKKMAATLMDNLGGNLEELTGGLETLAISFGELLIPILIDVVKRLQSFVDKLNAMDEGSKKMILTIAAVVASIGPVLTIVGKCISIFGTMKATITNVSAVLQAANVSLAATGTSLGAIVAPVLAVVAVIGVLVAAFKTLWDTNEEFREAMTSIWNSIVEKVQSFCQGIVDRLNSLGFEFENITEVLKAIWMGFCDLLAPYFEGVFNYISIVLSTTLDVILGIVDVFIAVFKGDWQGAWDAVKGIFETMWTGLVAWFENILNTLKGVANVVLGWFGTSWEEVWTSIKNFFVNIWNGISSFFTTILNAIRTAFTRAWNAIKTTVSDTATRIKDAAVNAFNSLKTGVSNAMNAAKTAAVNAGNAIKSGLSTAWNSAKSATTTAFNAVKTSIGNALQSAVSTVKSKCSSILSGMKNVFSNVKSTFSSVGKNVIQGIINGIGSMVSSMYSSIKNALSGLVNKAKSALGINSPSRVFRDMVGKYIPEGIAVGINANTGEAERSVMSMTDHLRNGAAKFRDTFADLMMLSSPYQLALAGADIRAGGTPVSQNNYSALNRGNETPITEKTEIYIEKIEVRDDNDLDVLTQGLYNKQDQNLRALGRRNL